MRSFLDARLFGAPLAASIHSAGGHLGAVAAVAIPLMIVTAVASHPTARASVVRQPDTANNATLPRVLSLWVFPAGTLLSGPVLPVAILTIGSPTMRGRLCSNTLCTDAGSRSRSTAQRRDTVRGRPAVVRDLVASGPLRAPAATAWRADP